MSDFIINGSPFDDLIDTFIFTDPSITRFIINADSGDDRIISGSTGDLINAGRGNDVIRAGSGNDYLNAGNGHDEVYGEDGDDVLNGAGGDDYLHGGKGNDTINGGSGNDTILGIKGQNDLFGGPGNDYISTGDNTSIADGGVGSDIINVRMKKGGDHVLTGGEGADTFEFVYAFSDGKASDCVITDYRLGIDTYSVDGIAAEDIFEGTGNSYEDVDGSIKLNLATGDFILFEEVSVESYFNYYGVFA